MNISEQVKELKTIANNLYIGHNMPISLAIELFRQAAATIEALSEKLVDMRQSAEDCGGGWKPISEYSREKYDWVLIKYFDGEEECVPQVAELRSDGKWHVSTDFDGDFVIPSCFDVRYFFDMQTISEPYHEP